MRFSFRKQTGPRWVDSAGLGWTPEEPFEAPPPRAEPAPEPKPEPEIKSEPRFADAAAFVKAAGEAPPVTPVYTPPAPANSNRPPSLFLPRLAIGVAQGLLLSLLLQARSHTLWPGSDPALFAALSLAGLFAPWVLMEGLGAIALPVLLPWTAIVAAGLAALGAYHHWRIEGADAAQSGVSLMLLVTLVLFIAQSLLHAAPRGRLAGHYRAAHDAAWRLAARVLLWAVMTGLAWALIGSGDSLLNWLRPRYPALHLMFDPDLVTMPLVGLASAVALHLTAGRSFLARQARNALLACCTIALPLAVALGTAALVFAALVAPLSLAAALTLSGLLLLTINASYRGDGRRGAWRRASEFAGAFLLAALIGVAALALHTRVAAFGWTSARVFAASATLMLGCYGAAYVAVALISVGGGRWMRRLEPVNFALALVSVMVLLALATPLADPVALSVRAQATRLGGGVVDPTAFDYAWMARSGVRFGHQALLDMTHSRTPEIARNAAIALSTQPDSLPPAPTEIRANITVRTPGARLPGTLLAQDWKNNPAVPPCLTRAALACDAWFLDLDGDGRDEILLVYGNDARWWAGVMKQNAKSGWAAVASLSSAGCRGSLSAMREGALAPVAARPGWRDLLVAGERLSPVPAAPAAPLCPR